MSTSHFHSPAQGSKFAEFVVAAFTGATILMAGLLTLTQLAVVFA